MFRRTRESAGGNVESEPEALRDALEMEIPNPAPSPIGGRGFRVLAYLDRDFQPLHVYE